MATAEIFTTIIPALAGILAGVVLGCGAVFVFNRIPVSWLTDYDGSSGEGAIDRSCPPSEDAEKRNYDACDAGEESGGDKNSFFYRARIKEYPWKWVFSATFAAAGIFLFERDWQYALPALVACFALLEIALADMKYMIIPDQFVLLIVLCGIGFIPYTDSLRGMLFGALAGGGFMLVVALLGRIIWRKEVMGFGDIKLFTALGFVCGFHSVIIILIGTSLCSCIGYALGILRGKIKKGDYCPLGPYIAAVSAVCILLGKGILSQIAYALYGF
ncbi:MAG: A24 family peptidase [Clostridia bacterium]|nr:A24 family peptidase [Clostridia bacterium]